MLSPLALMLVLSLFFQGDTGQLSGSVVDSNNAAILGAQVKLINQTTSQVREVTTRDSCDFAFTLLPPGNYKLEVTANGFSTTVIEDVRINITQTTTLLVHLDAATVSGMVTVNAEAPLAQQESSQIGRVIEGQSIRQLPLPTRNFQQLLTLSPGASASVSNNTELGRGDSIISVNGQRTTSNNVRINGVDANAIGTNSTPNIAVPATDSIQEFVVQTSLYDASHGRNAGGNVEAVTRSGGNDFHGNVYYFFRNKVLNENDFFLESAGQPTPVLSRHQFGGTIGGPIVRDHLFFFGSYQGTRETNGASLVWLAPAMADVHENTGPHLRGLGVGVFLCLVHVFAYGIGSPLMGKINDALGAASNPAVMRYGFLISPIACAVAAILLWRGSRSLEAVRQD